MTENGENTKKIFQILVETLGSMFPYLLTLYLLLVLVETLWKDFSEIFIMNNLLTVVIVTGILYLAGYKKKIESKNGEGRPQQPEQNIN